MGKKYYDQNSLIFGVDLSKCVRKIRVSKRRGWIESFFLSWKGLFLLLAIITAIWAMYAQVAENSFPKLEERGQAGDSYGGITALFSGLAFAGLIFTLFVQKKELEYQRIELSRLVTEQKETKGHLKAQAKHLKLQSESVSKQVFEGTFFQMLDTLNQYVNGIETKVGAQKHKGTDALEVCHHNIMHSIIQSSNFQSAYEKQFKRYKNDLAPYFRQIYNILKFLYYSDIEDKKFYSNILRAQLSSDELSLLACNGASSYGNEKMAPLMQEFDLLKHFDNLKLVQESQYIREYYEDWEFMQGTIDYLGK